MPTSVIVRAPTAQIAVIHSGVMLSPAHSSLLAFSFSLIALATSGGVRTSACMISSGLAGISGQGRLRGLPRGFRVDSPDMPRAYRVSRIVTSPYDWEICETASGGWTE